MIRTPSLRLLPVLLVSTGGLVAGDSAPAVAATVRVPFAVPGVAAGDAVSVQEVQNPQDKAKL